MIHMERVTHRYPNDVVALCAVSLRVAAGETVAVIGRSGCGKTTLLKLINGLIRPTHGAIRVFDEAIAEADLVRLRRRIGYVIQHAGLFPHLTVADNIALIASVERWRAQKILARTEEVLTLVGLAPENFLHKYPRELSGGEAQRVGIARALLCDPPLLLMDEPFSALDPITRRELQTEFVQIKQQIHKTIVLVTHHLQEAFLLGDRVALMDAGRIVQIGAPQELAQSPATAHVARFLEGGTL